MQKKFILPLLAASMLMATSAYAGTSLKSSQNIGYYDTYAKGSTVSMTGNVGMSGYNNSSSTNDLYVELYKQNSAGLPDTQQFSRDLTPNASITNNGVSVSDGMYYLWLDPSGPNYYGCIGTGTAQN